MAHEFKAFDPVLVRDNDEQEWKTDFYSHYVSTDGYQHKCVGNNYSRCIPYNENTAHLVGTNKPYEEPEPKIWNVKNIDTGVHLEFTQSQFEHFIKDISGSKEYCAYSIHRIN